MTILINMDFRDTGVVTLCGHQEDTNSKNLKEENIQVNKVSGNDAQI
jgi:hypothetical protein